jgi:plasmid stabilization system protein ParE
MKIRVEESEFIPCDVLDIIRWLRASDPRFEATFLTAFTSSVDILAMHPGIGRTRTDLRPASIRSWRIRGFPNILIFYEVLPDRIRLLRVLHGHRDLQGEMAGNSA